MLLGGGLQTTWPGWGGEGRGHLWAVAVVKNTLGACGRDPTCVTGGEGEGAGAVVKATARGRVAEATA